jgi:hypothetical protein
MGFRRTDRGMKAGLRGAIRTQMYERSSDSERRTKVWTIHLMENAGEKPASGLDVRPARN